MNCVIKISAHPPIKTIKRRKMCRRSVVRMCVVYTCAFNIIEKAFSFQHSFFFLFVLHDDDNKRVVIRGRLIYIKIVKILNILCTACLAYIKCSLLWLEIIRYWYVWSFVYFIFHVIFRLKPFYGWTFPL